jgi:hypothetical protein
MRSGIYYETSGRFIRQGLDTLQHQPGRSKQAPVVRWVNKNDVNGLEKSADVV